MTFLSLGVFLLTDIPLSHWAFVFVVLFYSYALVRKSMKQFLSTHKPALHFSNSVRFL
jgi:hypothetical protein